MTTDRCIVFSPDPDNTNNGTITEQTYHWYRRRYLFCCQAWDLRGSAGGAPLSNFRDGFTVSSSMGTSPRMADFTQGKLLCAQFRSSSVLGAVDATSKLRDLRVSNNIAPLCSPSETLAAFQFRFTMAFSSFVVQTTDTAPTASVPGNTTVSPASAACPRRHRCITKHIHTIDHKVLPQRSFLITSVMQQFKQANGQTLLWRCNLGTLRYG